MDYSNLINLYEEIINEISDELANKVAQKRKENEEKAWAEMKAQKGENKSINKMLLAAAQKAANEILMKQRQERKENKKHDPEDTEDLKVQRAEIKRNKEILKENREKDARRDLFVAYQRVFDTVGELNKQLKSNKEKMKSPLDEFTTAKIKKDTLGKAKNAFIAGKDAEAAKATFDTVSDKSRKEGKLIPFKGESLLDILEEIGTSIAAMMDVQPTPLVGATSMAKQKKGKQKRGQLGYKYLKIRKATMD